MLRYAVVFTAGFVAGKVVTKKNVEHFKNAALRSYVVVKDSVSGKETEKEAV